MIIFKWEVFSPKSLCAVDPITLTGLALAAGGGIAASQAIGGGGSSGAPPAPTIPQAAPPQQTPTGSGAKPATGNQPTFIGAAATPPVQSGQKSLLGQ